MTAQFKLGSIFSSVMFALAIQVATPIPSTAQITIGLDRGTRSMLEGLPEAIRIQLVQAIREALPLIDKSVDKYLARVDEILHKNVEDGLAAAQCSVIGIGAQFADSTKASLAGLLTRRSKDMLVPSDLSQPVAHMNKAISETRDRIKGNTAAKDIIIAYADLLHNVAIVRCQTKLPAPLPTDKAVKSLADRLYLPALEWEDVVGKFDEPKCTNARDCVVRRRTELGELIAASDPRDLKFRTETGEYDASQVFKALPPDPKPPTLWDSIYSEPIPILDYERLLINFRHIERAIEAQKGQRKDAAKKSWDAAIAQKTAADNLLTGARANFNSPTDDWVDTLQTIDRMAKVIPDLSAALATAEKTAKLDKDLTAPFNKLRPEIETSLSEARKLDARARSKKREIEERNQRARTRDMVRPRYH